MISILLTDYMVRVELKVLFVEIKLGLSFSGKVLS